MIKYTLNEIRSIAPIYDEINETQDYAGLFEQIIEEIKEPEHILMEFFGAYESAVYDIESWNILKNFLFINKLESMPLYINDSSLEPPWKKVIAQWRLKIGK